MDFPIRYSYKYCTPIDFIPRDITITAPGYLCRSNEANVVKIYTDTSQLKSTNNMFQGSTIMNSVALFDTSNVTSMNYMFSDCRSLIVVPHFDTSKVVDMSNMFSGCSNLYTIPHFDTSKVTSMNYMFSDCQRLIVVPHFDTSKVTSMNYMFQNCKYLTTVPHFDTSKVTSMNGTFSGCEVLREIPQLDTSNVTNLQNAFQNCKKLEVLPELACDKISNVMMFGYNPMNSIRYVGGFKNLGMMSFMSNTSGAYFIAGLPCISKESVLNILNDLYDRASAGYSVVTLKMHANHLAMLTDEEKAIATNKGWTLS